jgi:hypothetical protein
VSAHLPILPRSGALGNGVRECTILPASMADQKPRTARRNALELCLGILLGVVAASVWGPVAISWWYEPPSRDAFSCAGTVQKALSQFVMLQLGCAAAGGVALWLFSFIVRRLWSRRAGAARTGGT